jgi:hypothetical protein
MREESSTGYTLPDLMGSLIEMNGNDVELTEFLEASVARTGYSPAYEEYYEKFRFHVTDEALYEVRGRFPRITPASFTEGKMEGVERVQYQINLDGYSDLIVTGQPAKDIFSDVGSD